MPRGVKGSGPAKKTKVQTPGQPNGYAITVALTTFPATILHVSTNSDHDMLLCGRTLDTVTMYQHAFRKEIDAVIAYLKEKWGQGIKTCPKCAEAVKLEAQKSKD